MTSKNLKGITCSLSLHLQSKLRGKSTADSLLVFQFLDIILWEIVSDDVVKALYEVVLEMAPHIKDTLAREAIDRDKIEQEGK